MTGLRLRWRRAGTEVPPAAAPAAALAADEARQRALVWFALGLILALAFAARIYNVNWDANGHLHPDERHLTTVANDVRLPSSLGEYFDTDSSPLNPYNRGGGSFVYGTLPLFLTKGIASALDKDNYDQLVLVGRQLSAIFSAATVLIVFLIGRRLYGAAAGLIGSACLAAAPLAIQHAHFFVVDPFLTFFMTAVLYFSVRVAQEGRPVDLALGGLMLGLGTACKITALLAAPILVVAALLFVWPAVRGWLSAGRAPSAAQVWEASWRPAAGLAVAALLAFLIFRVAQPYAFESPRLKDFAVWTIDLNDRWVADQKQQSTLLSGNAAFPPSVQWIGRPSYLFPIEEMVRWGMSPAFGVVGWLGFAYALYVLIARRDLRGVLPVLFVVAYFGFMGRQFSLYPRYFLPLYPVLAIFAGFALWELVRAGAAWASRVRRSEPLFAAGFIAAAVVVATVFFGFAYLSIYTRPVTRVEASGWFLENVPPGKAVAVEHWDDRVPGYSDNRYRFIELTMYDPDSPAKVSKLIHSLDDADYIVLSSNRLLLSIPKNRATYPVSADYYDLLLSERLGFRLEKKFTSYPAFLGIEFPDDRAEESWSSYDHPPVWVFEKTAAYSHDEVVSLLNPARANDAVTLLPAQAETNALRLRPNDLQTQQAGGTWDDIFSSTGFAASHPALLWLIVLELAAFAVTPAALLLFRRLPDRGYLLSKPLGLVLLAYPVWLIVSLKLVHFTQTTILVWLILLILSGAGLAYVFRSVLAEAFRRHWRIFLLGEALFLLAFLVFYEFRVINPDLWHPGRGGEKPMDLAYLTAVTRSTTLPPYDPWFAGGYINYYYMGQFFTATMSKLTGIAPEFAFNLAVPMYFALTVAGAFSVTYNLTAASRAFLRRRPNLRPIPAWSPAAAGILGALFVVVVGNLDGVGEMVDRLSAASSWHVGSGVPIVAPVVNSLGGLWQVVAHGKDLKPEFDYWRPSRIMPPQSSITEFPYFTFLFADLHAHMMALPFDVLAIGASAGLALTRPGERGAWREWLLVALLGLVAGSLRWLNSWDYPPFLLLGLAAVIIAERRAEGGIQRAGLRVIGKAALLIAVSFVAFFPMLENYTSPVSGVHRSLQTTPLHQYLAHFGVFLAAICAWLAWQFARSMRGSALWSVARGGWSGGAGSAWSNYEGLTVERQVWISAGLIGAGAIFALALTMAQRGETTIAAMVVVLPLIAFLGVRELLRPRPDSGVRLFVLAMLGLGFGLSLGVDMVTINGDIDRMNTVFKFYLHIWLLFGISAAFAVWYLSFVVWQPRLKTGEWQLPRLAPRFGGGLVLTALVLAAAIYPVMSTPVRLDERFASLPPTLDGMAYMPGAVYQDANGPINLDYDYEGIQWLRHNVEGSPVIIEASIPFLYRWAGRFSIYTGLPTVLGWDWHQKQQRGEFGGPIIDQRQLQVQQFYSNPDTRQAIVALAEYKIRYVIVGQVERNYFNKAGMAKFESGLDGTLEVAYENPGLTIYRVKLDPQQLALAALK